MLDVGSTRKLFVGSVLDCARNRVRGCKGDFATGIGAGAFLDSAFYKASLPQAARPALPKAAVVLWKPGTPAGPHRTASERNMPLFPFLLQERKAHYTLRR